MCSVYILGGLNSVSNLFVCQFNILYCGVICNRVEVLMLKLLLLRRAFQSHEMDTWLLFQKSVETISRDIRRS